MSILGVYKKRIKSGTVSVDMGDFAVTDLVESLERTFRHVAENEGDS